MLLSNKQVLWNNKTEEDVGLFLFAYFKKISSYNHAVS